MFRKNILFLLFPLLAGVFFSCTDSALTVTPETVLIDANGNGQYVTVDAPGDWSAVTSADWVQLGMKAGNGKNSVYVYAHATTASRSAVVTFTCMDQKTMVSVTQAGPGGEQGGGGGEGGQGGQGGGQGGGSATAGTYTIDFNSMGYSDQTVVPSVTKDGISVSFEKGQASTPATWFSVKDGVGGVRVYAKSTFTVASSKKITKIELTFGTETQDKCGITSSPAGYTEPTWTGSAGSVTFTVDSEGKHRRIAKITVTLSSDDSGVNPGGGGGEQGGGQGGGQGEGGGSGSGTFVDILNVGFTGGAGSTTYNDWSGKKGSASSAVYAGHTAGGPKDNEAIQMRVSDNLSGIVSTTSGGKLTKVSLTWNAKSGDVGDSGVRVVQVYGSTTAYTSASDLYASGKQGKLIGELSYGQTDLAVSDNYTYVGLRSKKNALYLDEIKITWTK